MAVNIQLMGDHQFKVSTPLQPPPVLAPSSHVPAVACTSIAAMSTTQGHTLATICGHHGCHLPDVFLMLSNEGWVWMWESLPLQQHLTLQLLVSHSLCWKLQHNELYQYTDSEWGCFTLNDDSVLQWDGLPMF